MFLWWSDPYTWITIAAIVATALLAFRLLYLFLKHGRPRRWITWCVIMLWVLSVCPWVYISAKAQGIAGEKQNSPAPNLRLTLEDGRQVQLNDLKGRPILLDFWATWCGPCRASEPALNALSKEHLEKGLTLARISGDEDVAKWRRYLLAHPSHALEALDRDSVAAEAFGVRDRPTFVLIDGDGVVRWRQHGWTPYSYFILRHALTRVLG